MTHPALRGEHRGLDHKGVMRACVQEIHFCWGVSMQDLQAAVGMWERRNFPDANMEQRGLIVCEEAGELAHVILKQVQGIRPETSTDAHMRDAIGDIAIALMALCEAQGWSLEEIANETARTVLARDWNAVRCQ